MPQLLASAFIPAGTQIADRQRFDIGYAAGITDARAGRANKHAAQDPSLDPCIWAYLHAFGMVESQARLVAQGWTIVIDLTTRGSFDAAFGLYLATLDRYERETRRARRRDARRAREARRM